MHFLKEHYQNIIIHNFITKFNYQNIFQIPKITHIHLNLNLNDLIIDKKKIIKILMILELITNQKSLIIKTKKNKIQFKIKKGDIVGCQVILRKDRIFYFLTNLFYFYLPNKKDFSGFFLHEKNKKIAHFKLTNFLSFFELEKEFLKFQKLAPLFISIHTNSKTKKEFLFLLNSFNFPFQK